MYGGLESMSYVEYIVLFSFRPLWNIFDHIQHTRGETIVVPLSDTESP